MPWKLLMPSCGSSFSTKRDITNHISLSGIDITVSEPAEYNLQHRYPAVFVNDGQIEYLKSLAPSIFLFGLHARSRFDDYTPWAAESFRTDCPPFGGKGAEYHHLLFKTLLPELKTKYPLDDSRLAYGGYSLGGLAAVWSLFEYTDIPYIFSLCGSFWYPGFPEYCREHKVLHSNASVYLLNGKREGGKHGNRLENAPKYAAEVHQALRMQIAHTTVVFDPFGHHDKMLERFRAVQQWLTECWQL